MESAHFHMPTTGTARPSAVLPARAGIGKETGGADLGEPVIELAAEGELVITPGPMEVEIEVARNKHRVLRNIDADFSTCVGHTF